MWPLLCFTQIPKRTTRPGSCVEKLVVSATIVQNGDNENRAHISWPNHIVYFNVHSVRSTLALDAVVPVWSLIANLSKATRTFNYSLSKNSMRFLLEYKITHTNLTAVKQRTNMNVKMKMEVASCIACIFCCNDTIIPITLWKRT